MKRMIAALLFCGLLLSSLPATAMASPTVRPMNASAVSRFIESFAVSLTAACVYDWEGCKRKITAPYRNYAANLATEARKAEARGYD